MTTQACYECGKGFSREEMVNFGNSWVCATCKPIFMQKLKEGVNVAGTLNYAGFWIRFAAKFVDGIVLNIVGLVINAVFGVGQGEFSPLALAMQIVAALAYTVYFVGTFGATPGKMACGLKVVTPEGEKISYGRALGRHFAEFLSSLILLIGYIMAAFDEEKRALHDRICDTRVIKK
ncbi:MAG TPA: RDD family protein [Planctomycetota bacterium]|nr:RDD family protein [Planctomycetota bacterium]